MELDPKCLSLNATARMLHSVRSILARRWSIEILDFSSMLELHASFEPSFPSLSVVH